MKFHRMAEIASRAANTTFRASGGPRAFSWLQCLTPHDNACERLARFVVEQPMASPEALYRRATWGDRTAVPFADTPHALQLAVGMFRAAVLELHPRVIEADAAEHAASSAFVCAIGARSRPASASAAPAGARPAREATSREAQP